MRAPPSTPLTYREAGVDIDAGHALIERIKPMVARTRRPGVLGGLGGFGGLFELGGRYREPVLVSGTDGVGTKLKLAQQLGRHDTIGIDLVGMCVNDVLVQGAEPLFFLDYFATGALDVEVAAAVIGGIARGCEESGCALLGGETAEMPGMYPPGEYDLAGFCVGAVEKSGLLDGSAVTAGDVLVGVASSGAHSNGYSLIRRILDRSGDDLLRTRLGDATLADALLAPTRLYVKPMLALLRDCCVHALAHITGGGLSENIIRVVPDGLGLEIDAQAWPRTPLFDWIARAGAVSPAEMWRTFNCGVGFVVICASSEVDSVSAHLAQNGLEHWPIGRVVPCDSAERVRIG
ncbi:MAG: phosphoribosylformylglycinamidine cyclo-ligase [Lysobacterales bacterium]